LGWSYGTGWPGENKAATTALVREHPLTSFPCPRLPSPGDRRDLTLGDDALGRPWKRATKGKNGQVSKRAQDRFWRAGAFELIV